MLKIVIDPGHGQYTNSSPLDASFYEGTNNYSFALALKAALLAYEDVEVLLTRNDITDDPSLEERGKMAVTEGADVFYSIHSNAGASSAYGVEGYYSVNTPSAYKLLVDLCSTTSYKLSPSKVRRVVTKLNNGQDYYGVLRASKGVKYSMLIEQGFHTNAGDLSRIRLDEWHATVAEQQAKVFADFFKLEKKKASPEVEESPKLVLASELKVLAEKLLEIANNL